MYKCNVSIMLNIHKTFSHWLLYYCAAKLNSFSICTNIFAEITNREAYVNNKPAIGGLFDPRMGVLDPGLICPTDGLDYMQTPGYFGHIELARPLFYIQYLKDVIKVARCICVKCSKLLISKNKYKHLLI